MIVWLVFAGSAAVIVYCGARLSYYGDVIAEKSGLGRAWTGLLLLASVTSLPELATGISAVALVGVPDIAVGDVLGSCCFNLLILATLDLAIRGEPVTTRAQQGHLLSAGFGIIMLSVVALSLLHARLMDAFGWIGLSSALLAGVYLLAIRLIFFYEKRQLARFVALRGAEERYPGMTLRQSLYGYGANAVIVVAAATSLPRLGAELAVSSGLGQGFVGNILIAAATSLPEVVVCLAALRIGAVDLAIANLFGSNLFNLFILALDDFFFLPGPLLAVVDNNHLFSALTASAMTGCAIIGLTYRSKKKALPLSWDAVAMVFFYLGNLMLLYMHRNP